MHVAVIDPLPLFRVGVAAVLTEAGHTVENPVDVVRWATRRERAVIVLTLGGDADWNLLGALRERWVIALLTEASAGARAVRAGARTVVERDITPASLERVVAATLDGLAVVPAAVLGELGTDPAEALVLNDHQLTWLRRLAAGTTVSELAHEVGYSERAMYRQLRALYGKLNVENKMQAIALAYERGWLT